jgi:O-antigen/teichoic acid export membrane protein
MSITNRVFSNIFYLTLSEASSRIIIFIGTVYLARVLGKAGFGSFSLSLAVATYFWMVADMGVERYGTREIAKNKDITGELYNILNSLRLFLATTLFLIFSFVLYFIDMPLDNKITLLAGAFYAVAFSLSTDWIFRGIEKMQYILVGRLITSVLFVGGIYLFVKAPSDTMFATSIYSCSFLVGSLSFMGLLHRKLDISFSFKITFSKWWVYIKESFYFALIGFFFSFFIFVPILFMGFLSTPDELGIFSASHRLTLVIIQGGLLITLAYYPTLSYLYISDMDQFRKLHARFQRIIIGLALPACTIGAVLSGDIILLLYGASYIDSKGILNILIWLSFLVLIRASFVNTLLSANFHRTTMIVNAIGTIFIILFSLLLIPNYGGYGAAWSLVISEIITLILIAGLFSKKIYRTDVFNLYFIKIVCASAIMGLVMMSLHISLILNLFVGIVVYCILALFLGIITRKSIHQVCRVIGGR